MTWVVGGRHLFCARCIADIQVTLKFTTGEVKYFDAVKKIHYIGDNIIIGFAGTIRIAFEIIEKLQTEYKNIRKEAYAKPIVVAEKLQKIILHTYSTIKHTKNDKVEFLLLIRPNEKFLFKEFGAYKLVSPKFKIVNPSEPFELLQIGSGSRESDFNSIVLKNQNPFVIPDPNGGLPSLVIAVGKVALNWIAAEAMDYQKNGVSQHMHIAIHYHGGSSIQEMPNLPNAFPEVASNWKELENILKSHNVSLANAVALA